MDIKWTYYWVDYGLEYHCSLRRKSEDEREDEHVLFADAIRDDATKQSIVDALNR